MKPDLVNYPLPHPLPYERYTSLTQSFTVLQVETNMLMFRIWREVGGKGFIKVLFTSDFFLALVIFFSFFRSPNPPDSGPSSVTWPKFTQQEQAHLVIDVDPRVEHRFRAKKVAFWNEIVPNLLQPTRVRVENFQDHTQKDEL